MDEEERYNALLRLSNAALDTKQAEVERLRAEIAAMRPVVEAVADIENSDGSACLRLCDTMFLTTPTESAWRVQHRANCVIEQARAYVAQHPATTTVEQ